MSDINIGDALEALNDLEERYEELYSYVFSDYPESVGKQLIETIRKVLICERVEGLEQAIKDTDWYGTEDHDPSWMDPIPALRTAAKNWLEIQGKSNG